MTVLGSNFGPFCDSACAFTSVLLVTFGAFPCVVRTSPPSNHTFLTCNTPSSGGAGFGFGVSVTRALVPNVPNVLTWGYAPPIVSALNPNNGTTQGLYRIVVEGDNFGPNVATYPVTITVGGQLCTDPQTVTAHTRVSCIVYVAFSA